MGLKASSSQSVDLELAGVISQSWPVNIDMSYELTKCERHIGLVHCRYQQLVVRKRNDDSVMSPLFGE